MVNKRDFISVLARVRRLRNTTRKSNPSNSGILSGFIIEADQSLAASKGKPLSSAQEELYRKLGAAVGP